MPWKELLGREVTIPMPPLSLVHYRPIHAQFHRFWRFPAIGHAYTAVSEYTG